MRYLVLIWSLCLFMAFGCNDKPNKPMPKKSSPATPTTTQSSASSGSSESGKTISHTASDDKKTSSMTKEQLAKADEIIKKVTEDDITSVSAKKLFKIHCSTCHGFKGNMMVNGAKDLTKSKISLQESVAQVYYGKGLMTPYRGVLEDKEIVALCKYIEQTFRK